MKAITQYSVFYLWQILREVSEPVGVFQAEKVFLCLFVLNDRQTFLNLKDEPYLRGEYPKSFSAPLSTFLQDVSLCQKSLLLIVYTFLSPSAAVSLDLSAASAPPFFACPPGCALSFLSPLPRPVLWLALAPSVWLLSRQGYGQPLQQEMADS